MDCLGTAAVTRLVVVSLEIMVTREVAYFCFSFFQSRSEIGCSRISNYGKVELSRGFE